MSAGSLCAKVPTSRAVPQAEGWPVSENGPLPGCEIFGAGVVVEREHHRRRAIGEIRHPERGVATVA